MLFITCIIISTVLTTKLNDKIKIYLGAVVDILM